jgi:hypothetical protein
MRALRLLAGRFAVVRLPADAGWPWWATWSAALLALVRDANECTIICDAHLVPDTATAERDLAAFVVDGPIPFTEVGVLAGMSTVLATAGISVVVISTYSTDYLLVASRDAVRAVVAWRDAGYDVTGD